MNKFYQVLDNGRPADNTGFPAIHSSWSNSKFESLEEAQKYATHWVGYPNEEPETIGYLPDQLYDYSGYGDIIEIKTVFLP